jgi:tyrosine-protein phosphatase SIW14
MKRVLLISVLAWVALFAQGDYPAQPQPCDTCIPGVVNFAKLSDALWRGSQPTAEGFQRLEQMGVKTVVDFRHDQDDLELLKGTRLKYVRIPSWAFHPTEAHVAKFLKVVEDPANWPVYIHCAQGRDRTGYNAAAYRMVFQGWKPDDAIREMNTFRFNKIWIGNPGFLKKLDPERMKQKLKTEPKPALVSWQPTAEP